MADSATSKSPATPMTLEEARDEVKKCDQEIQSIKAALRGIGTADGNLSESNSLEIEFTKVEGLPEAAKPTLALKLSSPVEERELDLVDNKVATFSGVEISVATLTVDAKDADVPLGTATSPLEIAPLCALDDPKQPRDEYVKEVTVDIVAGGGSNDEGATVEIESILCSVNLKATYKPSAKDQREELYDLLNKTSQRKAAALGELRKRSIERARAGAAAGADASTAVTRSKPSVKPGFLNGKGGKKSGDDDDENGKGFVSTVKQWYKKITGPDSIVMKTAFWAVVTKDFWIFFGAVGLIHYRGSVLALPPPV